MKRKQETVLFPVPKDLVEKLIKLYSGSGTQCNNCDEEICPILSCHKCKKTFTVHNDQRHLCFGQRKCIDCKKYFCKECAKCVHCAKPTMSSYRVGGMYGRYQVGRCSGSFTRCEECLAKRVCEKCNADISRCYYCDNDPDSLAGSFITSHICGTSEKGEEYSGWHSGAGGYTPKNKIESLPFVD